MWPFWRNGRRPWIESNPKSFLIWDSWKESGWLSQNGHEALDKEISEDVIHHHQHRKMRKAELNRLKATLGVLKNKTQFLPKQANFYDWYNEHVGSRRKNWRHSSRFLRSGFAASIRRSRRSQQPHGSSASAASSQRCNGSSMVAAEEGGAATSAGCGAGAAVVKPIGPFRFTSREMYEKGVLLSI